MYHHVRRKGEKFFPKLVSLDFKEFTNQLDYLEKKYQIVNIEDLTNFISKKKKPKKKLCMLTFDDGYLNHYTTIYPELKRRNLQGFFFPPSKAIIKRKLMDSNKAHLLIASKVPIRKLNKELETLYYKFKIDKIIKLEFSELIKKYKHPFGYDNAETILFKRITQHVIPEKLRKKIFDSMLKKFVKISEKNLAKNMYITKRQAKEMLSNGMIFGNHCHDHLWLEKENEKNQQYQINQGLKFLKSIGMKLNNWIMCYPYGSYNKSTIEILKNKHCFLGLTSVNRAYNYKVDSNFEIPRIDCNNVFEY